jgi:hypothetical protein
VAYARAGRPGRSGTLAGMRRLASPGWLLKHAIVLLLVAAFLILGWWQLGRAKQGNALSLGYTFEWPFFAAFVIFMWVREMRITLHGGPPGTRTVGPDADPTGALGADRLQSRRATVDRPAGVTSFDLNAALARRAGEQRAGTGVDESSEYNQYLAWLAAHPDVRPRDYRPSDPDPAASFPTPASPTPATSPTPAPAPASAPCEENAHG